MIIEIPEALQPNTTDPFHRTWIRKTPGVSGGDACIRDTRIPVWGLVNWRRLGAPDEEICDQLPGLTPDDLAAAWDYADENAAEIEGSIRENEIS